MTYKYVHREAPILLRGKVPAPARLNFGGATTVALNNLTDRSRRWILVDQVAVNFNPRTECVDLVGLADIPSQSRQKFAALIQTKIYTPRVSLTHEFVPLLSLSQLMNSEAESEAFSDLMVGTALATANNICISEWEFPRPFLLAPGEAIMFDFQRKSLAAMDDKNDWGTEDGDIQEPTGGDIEVVVRGSLVKVNEKMVTKRDVPFHVAQTFDRRDLSVATPANRINKALENVLSKNLNMHSLNGRQVIFSPDSRLGPTSQPNGNGSPDLIGAGSALNPLLTITDYSRYDVISKLPFLYAFPPQISASLKFNGILQSRDVFRVGLETDQAAGRPDLFTYPSQFLVGLNGWREENL